MDGKDREADKTPPRFPKVSPQEAPYFEEQFDQYFTDNITQSVDDQDQVTQVDEEDSYWHDPADYWLEEGMWPWPQVRPKPKSEEAPPEDIEPPGQ